LKILQSDTSYSGLTLIGQYIGRCLICGQLWKVVWHVTIDEDSNSVWLKPGGEHMGYAFPFAEAAPFLAPEDLLHLPYVELLKHVPFDKLVEYRKQLEEKDPGLVDTALAG
jgi:hypothetical protein